MYKGLVISLSLILSLPTGALGIIGQSEGFEISEKNQVFLLGSPSVAFGGNSAIVGQSQTAVNLGFDFTIAVQNEVGMLNQVTGAVTSSAVIDGTQEADLVGQQTQAANSESSAQEQDQAINLVQDLNKSQGTGGAIIGQGGFIAQVQIVANSNGISGDVQFTGASQFSGINGGLGSDIVVNNNSVIRSGSCVGNTKICTSP